MSIRNAAQVVPVYRTNLLRKRSVTLTGACLDAEDVPYVDANVETDGLVAQKKPGLLLI
jgi:hypothetical protein